MSKGIGSSTPRKTVVQNKPGSKKDAKELGIHDLGGGIIKMLTDEQSTIDAHIKLLTEKKLADVLEKQNSMKADCIRGRKVVLETGNYVAGDLKPALNKLNLSAGELASLIQKKRTTEYTPSYKGEDLKKFIDMENELKQMQDLANQMNTTIAEMEAAIIIATKQMFKTENEIDEFNKLFQEKIQKEKEEEKQLKDEKKRKQEEEKQRKEEEKRKKKEEAERKRKEKEKLEKQKKEEEERRRLEEEERKREEEELERQRQEEERQRLEEEEKQRLEEEERRRIEEEEERKKKEEEERQRRIEEEARKQEEKRKKQEEEKKRKQEQEEKKRKQDPRNWKNVIVYEDYTERDGSGHGIACIVRAPDNISLEKNYLECRPLDRSANRYQLGENEELVSHLVNIRPADERSLDFSDVIWVSLPLCSTSKQHRDVIIKIQNPNPGSSSNINVCNETNWTAVPTRDATMQPGKVKEIIKFVETPLRHLPSEGLTIVAVAKPKSDRQTFNNKGGILTSSIDDRISVFVPRNAFKNPIDFAMQTIHVDTTVLKERYDGCENLLGTSPMVVLNYSEIPSRPLSFSISNPSGSGRRVRPKTGINERKTSTAALQSRAKSSYGNREENMFGMDAGDENIDKDIISLLARDPSGRWRSRDEITLTTEKESTSFDMEGRIHSLLLVRTKKLLEAQELVRIVSNLEESFHDRPVSFLIRQKASNPNSLYLELCKPETVSKRIEAVTEDQFTQGPVPSSAIIKEGDLIEVSFTGNIHFEDQTPHFLNYHSNLTPPRLCLGIKEVDGFAQNGLENFKGALRLKLVGRPYKPPSKFLPSSEAKKKQTNTEMGLLIEIPVSLPKPQKEVNRAKKIPFHVATRGILDEDYFDRLSEELADEWILLAEKLKISKAAIQRITTEHSHLHIQEATQRSAKQMFIQWYRSSTKASDKTDDLVLALQLAGRSDLAEELRQMNKEFSETSEQKKKHAILLKCIKAYTESQTAVNEWRSVGLALGLGLDEINEIEQLQVEGIRDRAREMLTRWMDRMDERATKEHLIKCLKRLNLKEAAGKIKLIS